MDDAQVNCVAIFDCIPDGELNTARRLRESLEDILEYEGNGLQVRYFRADTLGDFECGINQLNGEIVNDGLRPWVHLEGHGSPDDDGFQVANGSHCSWGQLSKLITPLNINSGFNLILILATCFGGSFARAIRTTDRAPVLGLVGPQSEIEIGEVERGFIGFYRAFIDTLSLKSSIKALNASAPEKVYYRNTALQFFYDVWRNYKRTYCTEENLVKRSQEMHKKMLAKDPSRVLSPEQLKQLLQEKENEYFGTYRDFYFMYDLDENNRKRFPITYEEAEEYVSR